MDTLDLDALQQHLKLLEVEHLTEVQQRNFAAVGELEQQIQDIRWQINKARAFYRFGV